MAAMIRSRVLHILLLTIITVLVYANSVGGDFVYDDKAMISAYDLVKDVGNVPKAFVSATSVYGNVNYYRPIQTVTYITDYFLWGDFPQGFHLSNVLIHIAAVLLLYFFIGRLFVSRAVAFVAAGMFSVHPVNTTVVSYIAGRADSLLCVFMLMCFIFYLGFCRNRKEPARLIVSLIFFILALMTKESAMIIPFAILLFDIWGRRFVERETPAAGPVGYGSFMAVLAVYLVFRFTSMSFFVEGAVPPLPIFNRLITAPYVLAQYFRMIVLPNDLHIGREPWVAMSLMDARVLLSFLAVGGLTWWCYRKRDSKKAVWFGLCWFLLMIFPSLNIITPLFYTIAENWLYIPSIGLFLIIAFTVRRIFEKAPVRSVLRYAVVILVAAFILIMGLITVSHNRTWQNEITLGNNTLRFNPREFKVYNNVGVAYMGRGDLDKAEESFWKCLEIKPDTGMAYFNLYRLYKARGETKQAKEYLAKAKELDPWRVNILIEKMGIRD